MKPCLIICLALGQPLAAAAGRFRNAPDVAERVAAEASENIQIHDGFQDQERKDVEAEQEIKSHKAMSEVSTAKWVVALDHDLKTKMLVQVGAKTSQPAIQDPCSNIACGSLTCPAGFVATTVPGHCCPYCVNPDIKPEPAVKGASGEFGGKASTFCDDVWCFPTMCTEPETSPSTTNGACCPTCPTR
uniref:Uncharacterized protein n=1 Tax=Alexandrium andersonii TaxID=327968 RepID=A0A7S2F8M6_9DINO|mmetsp:Transcript_19108/g.43464  ORF Transcript_19108/g.43464 Transcript_19108/m.43464 type:complete len:188 (+) Transcript_19108:77-640(+)